MRDIGLLEITVRKDIPPRDRMAFTDMLEDLKRLGTKEGGIEMGQKTLTEPQRTWLCRVAGKVGLTGHRGEVATPEMLKNLPKAPPGRRA